METSLNLKKESLSSNACVQLFSGEVDPATTSPRTASDKWYRSAWFIAVMSLVAIIILFILLALCLWRTSGSRTVYVRDREPLPPRTKLRSRPPSMSSLYTSSDRKNGSILVSSCLLLLFVQGGLSFPVEIILKLTEPAVDKEVAKQAIS